jgi:hypothetical protein
LQIFNVGNNNITDIDIATDADILDINPLAEFSPRAIQNLTFSINSRSPGYFDRTINISYETNSIRQLLQIKLAIYVMPENSTGDTFDIQDETCEEVGGQVCVFGTICNGTAVFTSGRSPEYCCLATCLTTSRDTSPASLGWIIGIVIIAILMGTGYYFYKKQKQIVPQSPTQQLKKQEQKFNKRISGSLTKV